MDYGEQPPGIQVELHVERVIVAPRLQQRPRRKRAADVARTGGSRPWNAVPCSPLRPEVMRAVRC
jgi:hypothetical protein